MINYLRHMAVFAMVVDEGSFRATAKALGLAPSRVSETISDLEAYLGITLFYRSTRKLSLTSEGRRFYTHVSQIPRNAESGLNELNTLIQKPIGELTVSIPAFLTTSNISSTIADFAHEFPDVNLKLIYSDQVLDPLDEGIDLSIRAGWPADSALLSRKLGSEKRLIVASKKYLESRTQPNHPHDIKEWHWIHFAMRTGSVELESENGEKVSFAENTRLSVNSAEALLNFALKDLGLTILPETFVEPYIKSGELVHVLPQWQAKPLGYYAIWPDKSRRESLTLLLVRYLAEQLSA